MTLTLVICTHNRRRLLARALTSIRDAAVPGDAAVQVLVVANACKDDTVLFLRDLSTDRSFPYRLRYYEEPRKGKSHALNLAVQKIQTGWLLFVDDDHRIDHRYLVEVHRALTTHSDATLFCGRILPDWDGGEPAWVHDTGPYRVYPLPVPHFELGDRPKRVTLDDRIPGGGNLIVHREVFTRVGGFATHLGPDGHNLRGGEDSDFVIRALQGGETLRYVPTIVQYHHVDPQRLTLPYLVRKSFQRSYSITLARHPQRVAIPRYQYRKLAEHLGALMIASFSEERRRFHLMRIAGTLGEMAAMLRRAPE